MLVKISSKNFHENPSGGTDGHYVGDSHFSSLTAEAMVRSQVCPCEAKRNKDRFFSECFDCTLLVSFHPCSILLPVHNNAYRANLILFIASPVQSQIYKHFKSHCIAQYFSERFHVQRVGEHHKNTELAIF
jgi:hypothetical protein